MRLSCVANQHQESRLTHSLSSCSKTRVYNDRDVQFFCRWITERLRGDVAGTA